MSDLAISKVQTGGLDEAMRPKKRTAFAALRGGSTFRQAAERGDCRRGSGLSLNSPSRFGAGVRTRRTGRPGAGCPSPAPPSPASRRRAVSVMRCGRSPAG